MNIKNRNTLISKRLKKSTLELREIGLNALEKAIDAVRPKNLMKDTLKIQDSTLWVVNDQYPLEDLENLYIIGGGKATANMAHYMEKVLKEHNYQNYKGVINTQEGLNTDRSSVSSKIKTNPASHPIPDEKGMKGVKEMMSLITESTKSDLIICLISGGGSSLLPLPVNGITLDDLKIVNSLLLDSGASIHEINALRKHISSIKGGNLAKYIYHESGAQVIALIISDVIGNDLDIIASGPTVPDNNKFNDALNVLKKYNLIQKIPHSVLQFVKKGTEDPEMETPKEGDKCFQNIHNYLIGSVESSVKTVKQYLNSISFDVECFSSEISGEAEDFGNQIYELLQTAAQKIMPNKNSDKKALIGSGELTVTIKGDGIGGRNQEMLLSFADYIKGKKLPVNFLVIGANLDGIEGNSKAMGALVDNRVIQMTRQLDLKTDLHLKENDSNTYFKKVKAEIITGPTGCNVNDLIFIILKKP
ncbi:MAG: DUF4147 domain-containing protein [Promethearchaeia archaeon]